MRLLRIALLVAVLAACCAACGGSDYEWHGGACFKGDRSVSAEHCKDVPS